MLSRKQACLQWDTKISEAPTIFILVSLVENGDSKGWRVVICSFKNHSTFI